MRVFLFVVFLSLIGCKDAIKNEQTFAERKPDKIDFVVPQVSKSLVVNTKEDLLGYWVGRFEVDVTEEEMDSLYQNDEMEVEMLSRKITLSIDEITNDEIKGHSIVSGNISPFKGTLDERKSAFLIALDEYEGKNTDGKFMFMIHKKDSVVSGKWIADHPDKVKVRMRKYQLKKRLFQYDNNLSLETVFINADKSRAAIINDTIDGEVESYEETSYFATTEKLFEKNASKEVLTKEYVSNLTKGDIYILRNSIFARHGFAFRDKQLRNYFENYDWYMPVFGDVKNELTEVEKKNVELLLRYEQNAIEYYDVFGR
ncbi:YARHG domain-containing protein [Flavobacterium enshiense]|uniref:YARHG domain-containing protein n=1 Tax=Flavobacterium enshiense TaxID=1341165 RepID=UPI00345D7CAA